MVHWTIIVFMLSIIFSFFYILSTFERSFYSYSIGSSIQLNSNNSLDGIDPDSEKMLVSVRFLRSYYSNYAHARIIYLNSITTQSNFATLYNVLVPEAYCPNLVRVGNVNDGGKWVCNPEEIPSNCSIFSLGIREDITFDRDIQLFNDRSCKIFGYDITPQSEQTKEFYKQINGEIYNRRIAAETVIPENKYALADLMKENNINELEILKIDIEGSEYQTIVPFLKKHKICQIFIELHGSAFDMISLLHAIAVQDYYLFSYEINGDSLRACEFSIIHSSCMKAYGAFPLAPYLKYLNKRKYL